jgi:hypothetical protein
MSRRTQRRLLVSSLHIAVPVLLGTSGCFPTGDELAESSHALARSSSPPGGIAPANAPQFVMVSFDDNFSSEGMSWATSFYQPLVNPAGSGNAATFDGAPVRTSFFHNSTYIWGNQAAWQAAFNAGHEAGNHTVNHPNGLSFSASSWTPEVQNCRSTLVSGLGATAAQISGFRAPYLAYNDALYGVLESQSPPFAYDTSIQSCWASGEDGTNCPWPYTLDAGSADAATVVAKFGSSAAAPVGVHAGFWEMHVPALIVPPDSLAATYGFPTGLRSRVQTALAGVGAPSFYEASTGKIAALDITLIVDARMTRAEALATLKYSLDLHLQGNRSPFHLIAHTHVYASGYGAAVNVPNVADRRAIITDFIAYALTKPSVRMRPVADVLAWMRSPVALGGTCTPSCTGRECGGNGCGGSCGTCGGGETCTSAGQCESTCTPSCSGRVCGSDGCGGSCGTCSGGQTCTSSGQCQSTCTPSCSGRVCGSDGCGGSCGTCSGGQTCTSGGQCQGGGGACSAPAWAATTYAVGDIVTAACQSSVAGTACFDKVGVTFAWRCTSAYWCSQLAPGGTAGGWWSAWTSEQQCN